MDPNEVRRRIEAIIEQQDSAFEEIRRTSTSFDDAMVGMRVALESMHAANEANLAALDRIIAANREARRILTRLPQ